MDLWKDTAGDDTLEGREASDTESELRSILSPTKSKLKVKMSY